MTDLATSPETLDAPAPANAPSTAAQELQGKAVELKRVVQQRAGEARDWAQGQAKVLQTTAKDRPLAAAGISAGTAFALGLLLGLLLPRPAPSLKQQVMRLKAMW